MSQLLTNIQPDDRLAHHITDSAVFAGLSQNASQLAVRYEPIVALRLDPQNPRLHSRKSVRQTDLRPYGRDARLHSRKRVRQIANRVRTFGFTSPVLIDSQYDPCWPPPRRGCNSSNDGERTLRAGRNHDARRIGWRLCKKCSLAVFDCRISTDVLRSMSF
jgi:hypothetical protein